MKISRLATAAFRMTPKETAWMKQAFLTFLLLPCYLNASPEGEQVAHGDVRFERNGNLTTIHASHNSIIDYSSFNIQRQETVQFIQPDALSRVLNRIHSASPTKIEGTLLANGQVYLVNPSGIFFSKDAVINVGALYASAAQLSNADFLSQLDKFTYLSGSVINEGLIQANAVHLIGQTVANIGSIVADKGVVTMVAGDHVLIGEQEGRIFVKIDTSHPQAETAVQQTGVISAPKGKVLLSAGDVYGMAIHHTGSTQAQEVVAEGTGQGKVLIAGEINTSQLEGQGGTIHVLGEKVVLADASLHADGQTGGGTILIGGDYKGEGAVRNAEVALVNRFSTLSANAVESGDGGKIIVWSNQQTTVDGSLSAKGGAAQGNGGFIETSSAHNLSISSASVDTSAPNGSFGSWLLDPTNVTVVGLNADTTELTDVNNFTVPNVGATGTSILNTSLNSATSNITIQAETDITFSAAVTMTQSGIGLTAQAGRNVTVNAAIATTGGSITLNGGSTASPTPVANGSVTINAGLSTNNNSATTGSISLIASQTGEVSWSVDLQANQGLSVTAQTVVGTGNITTSNGNINISSNSTIDISGTWSATVTSSTLAPQINLSAGTALRLSGPTTFSAFGPSPNSGNILIDMPIQNLSGSQNFTLNGGTSTLPMNATVNGSIGTVLSPLNLLTITGNFTFGGTQIDANIITTSDSFILNQNTAINALASMTINSVDSRVTLPATTLTVDGPSKTFGAIGQQSGGPILGAFTTVAGAGNSTLLNDNVSADQITINDMLFLGANIAMTGPTAINLLGPSIKNASTTAQSLTLSSSGQINITSPIVGLSSAFLSSLSTTGTALTSLTDANIFASRVNFATPVAWVNAGIITAQSSGITFGSTVATASPSTIWVLNSSGPILFSGSVGSVGSPAGVLTVFHASRLTFDSPVTVASMIQLAGTRSTTFHSSLSAVGLNSVTGGVIFISTSGSITVDGAMTTNDSTASKSGGSVDLQSTGGSILVNSINTSGNNATGGSGNNGGNAGTITLQPSAAIVEGDAPSGQWPYVAGRAGFTDNEPVGIIRLSSNLTALGGAGDGAGSNGTNGNISLGAAGRSQVPSVATIASSSSGNNVTIQGANLTIGQNEKMTVIGTLTISLSGSATLGDVNALGNLTVTANPITLLLRNGGAIVNNQGQLQLDLGLHYVTGGQFSFSNAPTVSGTGNEPIFFRVTPNAGGEASLAAFTIKSISPFSSARLRYQSTVLDSNFNIINAVSADEANALLSTLIAAWTHPDLHVPWICPRWPEFMCAEDEPQQSLLPLMPRPEAKKRDEYEYKKSKGI